MNNKRKLKDKGKTINSKIKEPMPLEKEREEDKDFLSFSLRYVQDDFCISKCQHEDQLAFIQAMLKRKALRWKDLHSAHKHGLGFEKIKNIIPTIPDCVKDNSIIACRFSGKKPMIGFRDKDVFYVVWFEKNYGDVYKHS